MTSCLQFYIFLSQQKQYLFNLGGGELLHMEEWVDTMGGKANIRIPSITVNFPYSFLIMVICPFNSLQTQI